jgi:prolyl 4-hydroxylase
MTTVLDQVGALLARGDARGAVAAMTAAAASGDGDGCFGLANWRLYGLYGPRDLATAHALLGRAAEAGHERAIRLLANLTANGTGVAEDPAAARALLARLVAPDVAAILDLAAQDWPDPGPAEALSNDPVVRRIPALLPPVACAYLAAGAAPLLQPSYVIDPKTRARMPHPHRTSAGMNFGPAQEDLVIRRINRRIAAASETAVEAGEPLHILAYAPGQQYRLHVDAIPGVANQRIWTMLVWLNEDYEGGETHFPNLGLTVRGRAGDGLLFANLTPDGRTDERLRHAGLPVTAGRKWLATRWIRRQPFSPFDPA